MDTFAKRLKAALLDRRMSQSDLARRIWAETRTDARGYDVVKGKDQVSHWCSGRSIPSERVRPLIAQALGVEIEHLFPKTGGLAPFEIKMLEDHPGECMVKLSAILPLEAALRIGAVYREFANGVHPEKHGG